MDNNILYEKVIEDLINNNYAQVDGFFTESTCIGLRDLLLEKEQDGVFKKANIGNKVNAKEALRSQPSYVPTLFLAACCLFFDYVTSEV